MPVERSRPDSFSDNPVVRLRKGHTAPKTDAHEKRSSDVDAPYCRIPPDLEETIGFLFRRLSKLP